MLKMNEKQGRTIFAPGVNARCPRGEASAHGRAYTLERREIRMELNILVADDDAVLCALLCDILKKQGYLA